MVINNALQLSRLFQRVDTFADSSSIAWAGTGQVTYEVLTSPPSTPPGLGGDLTTTRFLRIVAFYTSSSSWRRSNPSSSSIYLFSDRRTAPTGGGKCSFSSLFLSFTAINTTRIANGQADGQPRESWLYPQLVSQPGEQSAHHRSWLAVCSKFQ